MSDEVETFKVYPKQRILEALPITSNPDSIERVLKWIRGEKHYEEHGKSEMVMIRGTMVDVLVGVYSDSDYRLHVDMHYDCDSFYFDKGWIVKDGISYKFYTNADFQDEFGIYEG